MVSNNNFLLEEVPEYHPLTTTYLEWWKEQKTRCIEGFWVSGKWMPGKLYFYANFGTIRLNKAGAKTKSYGQPTLRDIEWELAYNWEETRGFSGFSEDTEVTCVEYANKPYDFIGGFDAFKAAHPEAFKADGTLKKYIPARKYLRTIHPHNLGKPLYTNQAKNFLMLGPRGYGKSYYTGVALVLHEWLFDGATEYTPETINNPNTTDIVVGAGDAKYSNDILAKTRAALERIPGAQEISGDYYPSPFFKQYTGSWQPGKSIKAEYSVKEGGSWLKKGTQSSIKNRTFKDNPYAAQGSRASIMVFEEIGMFDNLRAAYAASVDVMRDGANKYGSAIFIGTGGDMHGGGTKDAHYMFYHPWEFDMVEFEDTWENQGRIGYFVPGEMGLDQYKDDEGNTNWEQAREYLTREREKLSSSRGSSLTLQNHIVYHPLKPSEIFLIEQGSILPSAEAARRLTTLNQHNLDTYLTKKVELYYDPDSVYNGVNYAIDTKNKLTPIDEYPWTHDSKEGAVVIYEFPILDQETEQVPEDLYVIGHDPIASDSEHGQSLASIYVLKTPKYASKYGYNEVVAEYIGRPYQGRNAINDILLKLSLFYGNAKVYFENAVGNVKEYFEKKKKLSLLAKQPTTVLTKKASYSSSAPTIYGYPMSNQKVKLDGLHYMRDWLLEERGENDGRIIRNIDLIPSKGLLQEIVAHNMDGNFDRVMGFMGCVIALEEHYNLLKEEATKPKVDYSFLTQNKALFNNTTTTAFSAAF